MICNKQNIENLNYPVVVCTSCEHLEQKVINDTINKSIITGHYGEIFKEKDSAIITRNALAVNIIKQDSLYIHSDTITITGPDETKKCKKFALRTNYNITNQKEKRRKIGRHSLNIFGRCKFLRPIRQFVLDLIRSMFI